MCVFYIYAVLTEARDGVESGAGNLKSTTGHRQGFHVCQCKGSLSGKISFDGQTSDLM